MLKTIGLEQIQTQGLEGLVFDLLSKKIYNEPFFVSKTEVPKPSSLKLSHLPSLKTSPGLTPTTLPHEVSHSSQLTSRFPNTAHVFNHLAFAQAVLSA